MQLQLIQGHFNKEDAAQIIREMINIKINFHSNKITRESSEELIKFREKKILSLQNELKSLNHYLSSQTDSITLNAQIDLS